MARVGKSIAAPGIGHGYPNRIHRSSDFSTGLDRGVRPRVKSGQPPLSMKKKSEFRIRLTPALIRLSFRARHA
jgi:hypothetical protein